MAVFTYSARSQSGELTTGQLDATDKQSAAEQLRRRSLIPIRIDESLAVQSVGLNPSLLLGLRRVSLDELAMFSRQMYSLIRSGIPILRAISGLADSTHSRKLREVLLDLSDQLERGRTLSTAMNQHSDVFSSLFVSIVHVGENTGRLDAVFLQLSEYLEREQETRRQIKAATRYPVIVIGFIVVAMFILNIFVVPQFSNMFAKFGAELPLMTRILIGTSNFFVNYWYVLILGIGLAIYLFLRRINSESGRVIWDKRKLKFPIMGTIIERATLARFARSFGMMLNAGVPMTIALNLVAEAVGNKYIAQQLVAMRRNIEKGDSLLRASNNSGLFTPLILQMVAVGEETGQVDTLLTEVAQFYEREVDYDVKNVTAKIEPILLVVVAGMVLVLALGIFTPMWDMATAIKG
ncbi:type II secretion system F family protein [Bowmanella sp. JS7-9]|uniref:Type II secretion system F family protein n=1 Tax=Pseudobowmanella zhangzhouensis TaxID=1537679 RepID=A0ABW1XPH3_9ALTE|nr:type II secretion system F family protein [Bowmanella sp. JS7-9]TBX21792.1 MSHA biogenesis protein MshG [Bowmanella sp. JS7-9]